MVVARMHANRSEIYSVPPALSGWWCILLLVGQLLAASACVCVQAHEPFESNALILVTERGLEASLVTGSGLAAALLGDSVVPAPGTTTTASPTTGAADGGTPLPLDFALRLFEIEVAGVKLAPEKVLTSTNETETTFLVIYPLPSSDASRVHAHFARHLPAAGFSSLVVMDEKDRLYGSHIIRQGDATAAFSLAKSQGPAGAATMAAPPPHPSFLEYFQMGVHHILAGPDHLLFLCGLLVVSRRIGGVIAIITSFTLAHSVTLALAALDIATMPAPIVEPIIAASIVFVGVENFRKQRGVKLRCGLAFVFGLIHGFGLAGALREAGLGSTAGAMFAGLLSFNLGVEAGQLAVAAVFLAVLWQLRKIKLVERHVTKVVSIAVIVAGGWWLVERTVL